LEVDIAAGACKEVGVIPEADWDLFSELFRMSDRADEFES